MATSELSRIPKIDRLAATPAARSLVERYGYSMALDALRAATAEARASLLAGDGGALEGPDPAGEICRAAAERLECDARPSLRSAINATGIVLHTGLGRAVLGSVHGG